MSSILKALEKVEESHSTRRNLGVGVLAKAGQHRPSWVLPAAVLGGAAFAALITFAVMGGFSRSGQPVPGQAGVAPSPQPQGAIGARPVSVVAPPLQTMPGELASNPKVILPLKAVKSVAKVKSPSAHAPLPAAKRRQTPAARRATPVRTSTRQTVSAKVTAVSAAAPAAPEKTRPRIRVTGIAWQKESASSAALVNGHAVQQGGTVEGLKVEEIFQDKVRFSSDKGTLDVPLSGGE